MIIAKFIAESKLTFNKGTNSSGQVPVIPNLPGLIDAHTPESAYKRTGDLYCTISRYGLGRLRLL